MDASCVLRRSKTELAPPSSQGTFAIGLPMLEVGTRPGSESHFPGVVWDGIVSGDPSQTSGVQQRDSGRKGRGRKMRATAAGRRRGGKGKET
jgi:hypothetical protein